MSWLEVIDCERSVRGADERPISVFRGAVGDHLRARQRRASGIVNQAVHLPVYLSRSASGKPKD
jgi:hypothetical protein